ncbi:MAG: hypothetical protein KDA53_09390 [Hyphomonas sp.]|nr:hypothetical protein [Hyphomonas sp.]
MKARLAILALALLPLTACATMEPKPCTQEWIDYKSDRILRKFASENRSLINDLRRLADADGDISPLAAMSLMGKSAKIELFANSFNDIVLPELDAAVAQCGTSEEFIPAFTGFLRKEGVSEAALEWVAPIIGLMQDMRNGTAVAEGAPA